MGPAEIVALSALAAEARTRADAAAPGPWSVDACDLRLDVVSVYDSGAVAHAERHTGDAAFIASARDDVPALTDGVAALVAALAEMTARAERAEAFARHCRDNYDCDPDAHAHGTSCRACDAAALLGPEVAP